MRTPGTHAPDFTLPGTRQDQRDEITTYRLADALGDGPVLLNFYLFDFHPACSEHLCALHDLLWFEVGHDVTVFGISTDRAFSHNAFARAENLDFSLLSDSDAAVAADYDVLYDEFANHKHVAKRAVFVIDTDHTIRYAWSTEDPQTMPDWSEVRAVLSDLDTAATATPTPSMEIDTRTESTDGA